MKKRFFVIIVIFFLSCNNKGEKFIGIWTNPNYTGENKDVLIISSLGEGNFLIERQKKVSAGLYVVDTQGSFKEVATLNGNNLELKTEIGTRILAIVNNNLLFESIEYIKLSSRNDKTNLEEREDIAKTKKVILTPEQEVIIGLQVAPFIVKKYGGIYPDKQIQKQIRTIGNRLLNHIDQELYSEGVGKPYKFNFNVLRNNNVVDAYALPSGDIFITGGLLMKLNSEDQLAAVLGKEIAYVIHRYSSKQIADFINYNSLGNKISELSVDDLSDDKLIFDRIEFNDKSELESDKFALNYMIKAGYNPDALPQSIEILAKISEENQHNEYFKRHPVSENRIQKIKEYLRLNK